MANIREFDINRSYFQCECEIRIEFTGNSCQITPSISNSMHFWPYSGYLRYTSQGCLTRRVSYASLCKFGWVYMALGRTLKHNFFTAHHPQRLFLKPQFFVALENLNLHRFIKHLFAQIPENQLSAQAPRLNQLHI